MLAKHTRSKGVQQEIVGQRNRVGTNENKRWERQRQRERDRERETDRQTHRQTHRDRDRQKQTERETHRAANTLTAVSAM